MAVDLRDQIHGLDVLKRRLESLTPELRRGKVAKALRAGGKVVQLAANRNGVVPVLAKPIYRKGVLIRKPRTVQLAIRVRNSKDVNRTGDVGVFVNVKPAKGSARGTYSPNDPYYWRWLEFGTKNMRARPFLKVGGQTLTGPAFRAIEAALRLDMQQLNLKFFP
jgi:HK97 gp10 family phage protein